MGKFLKKPCQNDVQSDFIRKYLSFLDIFKENRSKGGILTVFDQLKKILGKKLEKVPQNHYNYKYLISKEISEIYRIYIFFI